jgi:hypothetical protein
VGAAPLSSAAPAPSARPTRCAAQPSTVYGSEDVVFAIEGEAEPDATLEFELRDERGKSVSKGSVAVPGQLKQPTLPSGDFVLVVGDNLVRCAVTVNRELPRVSKKAP